MMERTPTQHAPLEIYSPGARRFHWWTVALVAVQVPLGLYMAYRGNTLGIFDGLTNTLYSSHKLIGITIFLVVLGRLIYRLSQGAPPPEPTITWWQRGASFVNHWGMYALLLIIPIYGYIGISQYPALDIFGIPLPGVVPPNQDYAAVTFNIHFWLAMTLVLLVAIHVAAALFHYLIRGDNVLARMLPSLRRD
jgi:cytochrome b561